MATPDEMQGLDDVFLVVAPAGRDADVIAQLLKSADLGSIVATDVTRLATAITEGGHAGAIVTDDALARIDRERLQGAIDTQPPWSDFPFILLTKRGDARSGSRPVAELVNVTVLERPLHPASLVSAARAALRARKRQRQTAQHLAEREKSRADLRDLADTLEAKVEERTRALAGANDRLTAEIAERERAEARLIQAQKMEAIGQLTGGIAHDFNNLLTAVIGSLDLLLRRTDDPKITRLAGMALQAGQRGATLTSQLLSFSRRQRLSPAPIEPNQVIGGMRDLLVRSIAANITIDTDLAPDLWRGFADPSQLEVVLLNLAINSRDAMPTGGTLKIATRNVARVPAALSAELTPGQYVAIEVADNGSGMPALVLARAFEPFFTTKEQGKGTGLGLAQVYGFARQSGGTVRIVTAEGEGTAITLFLPRTQDAVEKIPNEFMPSAVRRNARILLVDDDDEVRGVAAQMVEEIGYEVVATANGAEALRRFEANDFALVLTDVMMPGMSGVDLARRIRAAAPSVPILFASGYADVETFGEELSAETVLRKPYRMGELATRIARVLDEKVVAAGA